MKIIAGVDIESNWIFVTERSSSVGTVGSRIEALLRDRSRDALCDDCIAQRLELSSRQLGFDFDGDERTVDVHVRRLRAKIEEEAKLPAMVHTIHGFGYKFVRA
ncbi:MAG: winged helix-turn-helix domain-containing protein [Candidatus Eremiobacteraeota bacterium]|nr:winged helix-turn-helix domain-containing protein [Candidatus Eremiobacteraeota bacterium]